LLPLGLVLLGPWLARAQSNERRESDDDADRGDSRDADRSNVTSRPTPQPQVGDMVAVTAPSGRVVARHVLTEKDLAGGLIRVAVQTARTSSESAEGGEKQAAETGGAKEATSGAASGSSSVGGAAGDPAESGATSSGWSTAGKVGLLLAVAGGGVALARNDDDHRSPSRSEEPPTEEPPPQPIEGYVIKGYISGAAVFIDRDGDGLPDPGQAPVHTDAHGRFVLPAGYDGPIVAVGGVDTLTHVSFDSIVLSAPEGASAITPLTTLVHALSRNGMTAEDAEQTVLRAFGLSLSGQTSLLDFDPVANIATGAGAQVEDAGEMVMSTLWSIQSVLTGAGVDAGSSGETALAALAGVIAGANGGVDLTDATVIAAALRDAFESRDIGQFDDAALLTLSRAIASVNGVLDAQSGLGQEALQATRFAQTNLQDLMLSAGQGAPLAALFDELIANPSGAISESGATSLPDMVRTEGGEFEFALRPQLQFVDGASATVSNVTLRFLIDGAIVEREVATANGIERQVLTPDANGTYTLAYHELSSIHIRPPEDFNGALTMAVTVFYEGIERGESQVLSVDITSVNDAPSAGDSALSVLEHAQHVFAITDFAFADANDAGSNAGADELSAIRIMTLPATGQLQLNGEAVSAQQWISRADIEAGRLVYVAGDASGTASTFTFQVRDDGGSAHGGVDVSATSGTITVTTIDVPGPDQATLDIGAMATLRQDAAGDFVLRGEATPGASLRIELSAAGGEPQIYSAVADLQGRFHVQIDAAALSAATVAVAVVVVDRDGNESQPALAQLHLVTGAAPVVINGTQIGSEADADDFIQSNEQATVFEPGSNGGQDHFIGGEGFDTVRLDGVQSQYSITFVSGAAREAQALLLQSQGIALDPDQPLLRIVQLAGDNELWVQADRLLFDDGAIRIAGDALVAGNEGSTLIGGAGADHFVGGMGADLLFGGDGTDTLVGGMGNDTLISQGGGDILLGGGGADTFVIAPDASSALEASVSVADFEIGVDTIDLSGLRVREQDQSLRILQAQDLQAALVIEEHGASIDLSHFVTGTGEQISGLLSLQWSSQPRPPALEDFILDPQQSSVDHGLWDSWNIL
jgi:hypothetical protein